MKNLPKTLRAHSLLPSFPFKFQGFWARGLAGAQPCPENEVIINPEAWFVKVVYTLFVSSRPFDSYLGYLSSNLTPFLAFEVIRRLNNPKLGLNFFELSRVSLGVNHNVGTYNFLLRSLCQMGLQDSAKLVFDYMRSDGIIQSSKYYFDLSGKLYVYYPEDTRNVGVVFNNIYELGGLITREQYHSANTISDSQKVIEYDGKSLLSIKQNKRSTAAQNEFQMSPISYSSASDHQLQLPRLTNSVPSEQNLPSDSSLPIGGQYRLSWGHFQMKTCRHHLLWCKDMLHACSVSRPPLYLMYSKACLATHYGTTQSY